MKLKQLRFAIILILILSIIINFISTPIAYAFDPVTMTLGYMGLSWAVSEAVYLFVLASAAVGVTYATWQEAKKVYDMYEGTSPAPLDFPDWTPKTEQVKESKADLARENWFSQWDLEVLPGGLPPGDPDPQGNKRGILGLMGAIGVMGGFINNFISMFKSLELQEGVNVVGNSISDTFIVNGYLVKYYPKIEGDYANWYMNVNGSEKKVYTPKIANVNDYASTDIRDVKISGSNFRVWLYLPKYQRVVDVTVPIQSGSITTPDHTLVLPDNDDDINIMVDSDSPIINPNNIPKIPQPNLIPIRRLRKEIDKNGNSYLVWEDTGDRLIEEIVLNTPIDEILNPEPYPYTIEPRPEGGVIIRPEIDPTTPYPNPFPQPQPVPTPIYPKPTPDEPNPLPYPLPPEYPNPYPWITPPTPIYPPVTPEEPDPLPYPLPPEYPDPYPWLPPTIPRPNPVPYPEPTPYPPYVPLPDPIPYPNPSPYPPYKPDPIPEPSPITPVEPGHQIDYTPWLQIIINWLSKIWHKIPEDKDQEQEEIIQPGIDFSPLQGISLTNKFPFSLPWDIKASFDLLVAEPQAPKWIVPMVTEEIEIDLELFESLALISRSFLSIIFMVMLVILTRRFIGGS